MGAGCCVYTAAYGQYGVQVLNSFTHPAVFLPDEFGIILVEILWKQSAQEVLAITKYVNGISNSNNNTRKKSAISYETFT